MITDGFTYFAVLLSLAAFLIGLEHYTKSKFFKYMPPVVLLYVFAMIFCTLKVWDLGDTQATYEALKNNVLYCMIFMMLLRCDIRKIVKLGPKMLGGFFAASISIGIGFVITFAVLHNVLGAEAWKPLAALCGSWMGGSGNMMAIQAALNISEGDMAYALVVDSIDYSIWVMFLLWIVNFAAQFNKWTKANTQALDAVCSRLESENSDSPAKPITYVSIMILLASSLLVSAICQKMGVGINAAFPFLDKATWTVMVITVIGLVGAVTPMGKLSGSSELSNVMLYIVIALLASRANLSELTAAPLWILTGFMILGIHAVILLIFAKIFKLDMFTCGVASLANIGGTASAPILAASYSSALVPVGVLMALMGYIIGTYGGLIVGQLMRLFA
ncbi:MAG: DUF819 family protein [Clostridiales bacterium]